MLFNLNYEYRHKLWKGLARYETSGWGRDFSVGTQVGVGNLITFASAWIEYRFGWDIPMGFTKFADPPALGIALDPIYSDPEPAWTRPAQLAALFQRGRSGTVGPPVRCDRR